MMTCLVFSLQKGRHVHFIDGADGGYALAALQLKAQLQKLAAVSPGAMEAPRGRRLMAERPPRWAEPRRTHPLRSWTTGRPRHDLMAAAH